MGGDKHNLSLHCLGAEYAEATHEGAACKYCDYLPLKNALLMCFIA